MSFAVFESIFEVCILDSACKLDRVSCLDIFQV